MQFVQGFRGGKKNIIRDDITHGTSGDENYNIGEENDAGWS